MIMITEETTKNENSQLVKSFYAAFSRGDIQKILDGLSDNIEWFVPGPKQIPYAGTHNGKENVKNFFVTLGKTAEFNPFELKELVAQGDKVVALGYYGGRAKTTGNKFEADWAMVWTVKNGKAVSFKEYMDPTGFAKAFSN